MLVALLADPQMLVEQRYQRSSLRGASTGTSKSPLTTAATSSFDCATRARWSKNLGHQRIRVLLELNFSLIDGFLLQIAKRLLLWKNELRILCSKFSLFIRYVNHVKVNGSKFTVALLLRICVPLGQTLSYLHAEVQAYIQHTVLPRRPFSRPPRP